MNIPRTVPRHRHTNHFPIFEAMEIQQTRSVLHDTVAWDSEALERTIQIDCFFPAMPWAAGELSLLLINDGQDMANLDLAGILEKLYAADEIRPLLCVAMHAGEDRKQEYGTASVTDYKGRGSKATQYTQFVLEELIPFIRRHYHIPEFRDKAMAGFSLGALSALDIVWHHPAEFATVGVFSGSLWWRMRDQDHPDYSDATDRIMHQLIRDGGYYPWLRFFFECGAADEGEDRNNNGIIDSIDDTLDLIAELKKKGYGDGSIRYLEMADGRHDVATWARAMPDFLRWGWGK